MVTLYDHDFFNYFGMDVPGAHLFKCELPQSPFKLLSCMETILLLLLLLLILILPRRRVNYQPT